MGDTKRKPTAGTTATGSNDDPPGKQDQGLRSTPKSRSRQQAWADRNPLATWAHAATRSAIRRGLITRPDRCERCGKVGPVDAHHDPKRYAEPLTGICGWFCRACHVAEHRRLRRKAKAD